MSGGRSVVAAFLAVCLGGSLLAHGGDIKIYRLSMNGVDPGAFATAAAVQGAQQREGGEGNGPSGLSTPSVSADGTLVAFDSEATNLERPSALDPTPLLADTNGFADIFLHDTRTRLNRRISLTPTGGQANGPSANPVIADDVVVFESDASNLVAGDSNAATDIFLFSLRTGGITLVSRAFFGGPADGASRDPVIGGGLIAFESDATNMGQDAAGRFEPDTNGFADVYAAMFDGEPLTRIVRVSRGIGGPADGPSGEPAVAQHSRIIAFSSRASNLVSGDSNGRRDIFVASNSVGGQISLVSAMELPGGGVQPANGDSRTPSVEQVSGMGHVVAFASDASNLAGDDTNGASDVFVRALPSGTVSLLSRDASGAPAKGWSGAPDLSPLGLVAFSSDAFAGSPGGASFPSVFLTSMQTGGVESISPAGADGPSYAPAISADGLVIAYASDARNLVADDTNGVRDVFGRLDERRCSNGATEDGAASQQIHGAEGMLGRAESPAHGVSCALAALGL